MSQQIENIQKPKLGTNTTKTYIKKILNFISAENQGGRLSWSSEISWILKVFVKNLDYHGILYLLKKINKYV